MSSLLARIYRTLIKSHLRPFLAEELARDQVIQEDGLLKLTNLELDADVRIFTITNYNKQKKTNINYFII